MGSTGDWETDCVPDSRLSGFLIIRIMRRFSLFVITLILVLAIFPVYTRFKVAAAPVAPGVYLGGLDLSTLKDADEIRAHLETLYTQPISVYFADERLVLEPQEVDFHVDVAQMIGEAEQFLDGPDFLDIAVRHAVGLDQRRRDVPVRYMLDSDKLRAWLEQAAADHNRPPQRARALPPSAAWYAGLTPDDAALPDDFVGLANNDWHWTPGAPGYTLDIDASIPRIIQALASSDERMAELALIETPPPTPNMDDLARALDSYTSNFPGFAAIYVHDLTTGEEAQVDDAVAFSGMSTLKIAIVTAIMQQIDDITPDNPASSEIGQWIDFALGESNNYAANLLLRQLGGGDMTTGARTFTAFMRDLGLDDTYMQSGYDFATQLAPIPTAANTREDWDTDPDSNLQSTPRDMGRLLSAVYDCTQGTGLLLERFPDDFTPDECMHILFYMSHNEFQELLWGGLPQIDQTWLVHKHGFAFESHSDVALVYGPAGPYVVSVFLFRSGWMDWETSNGTMKNISRIIWNFFDFYQQQTGVEPGAPLELEPPPGYIPLGQFVPAE